MILQQDSIASPVDMVCFVVGTGADKLVVVVWAMMVAIKGFTCGFLGVSISSGLSLITQVDCHLSSPDANLSVQCSFVDLMYGSLFSPYGMRMLFLLGSAAVHPLE